MTHKHVTLLILLACLLSACTPQATPLPATLAPHPTFTHTPVPPTFTLSPTHTRVIPTPAPTKTVTPTASPTPEFGALKNCLEVQPTLPAGQDYTGLIALEDQPVGREYIGVFSSGAPQEQPSTLALFDLSSSQIITLTTDGKFLTVSPDHSQYAYKNLKQRRLEIYAWDQKQVKTAPWKGSWHWLDRWIDNQNFLFVLMEPDLDDGGYQYPPNMQLYNPFSGNLQTFKSGDYPYIDQISYKTGWPWPPSGVTIYSPDMQRVVYPGGVEVEVEPTTGYSLYAIPEGKSVAGVADFGWFYPPVWTPDGSKFIMDGNNELYVVSYDGEVTQVTHLNPERTITTDRFFPDVEGVDYAPEFFAWAPDNRHVAFWLYKYSTKASTLVVLDTQTGSMINTCISTGKGGHSDQTFSRNFPVWSPDSKTLVVAANFSKKTHDLILIDLEKNAAYLLTNDFYPAGWLRPQ